MTHASLLRMNARLHARHLRTISGLGEMATTPTTVCNKETSDVINALPPELLAKIFALSKPPCILHSFQNITGVCKYWRHVATEEPRLWTHVDISPEMPAGLSEQILERTGNRSITVHLHASKSSYSRITSQYEAPRMTRVLAPHIHRVCSLDIFTFSDSKILITAVLNLWLTRGNPSLAKSLWIARPESNSCIYHQGRTEKPLRMDRSENSEAMLAALAELRLQHFKFSWDSGGYRGLTHLQLDFENTRAFISLQQFANILSANPELLALKLNSIDVYHSKNWSYPTPIELNHLEDLSITFMANLRDFLPLIKLPTSPAKLRVGLTPRNQIENDLQSFLLSSRVTSLYWYNWYSYEPAPVKLSFLKLLPYLRSLLLHDYDITNESITYADYAVFQPLSPSCLALVVLLDCIVSFGGLKALVAEHGVQELCLVKCKASTDGEDLQTIRTLLEDTYPELKCFISNKDSRVKGDYDNRSFEKN